jgi:TolB-like protein
MKSISFLLLLSSLLLTGCVDLSQFTTPKAKTSQIKQEKIIVETKPYLKNEVNNYSSSNLNEVIIQIANQLFHSNTVKNKTTKIILTTFVDLDNLEYTTTFGRMLSESMFNELHINKFNVTDFRGQDAISVTNDGEFHITRETENLKDTIETIEYILVGTYVEFENKSFLINSRIIDSVSGNIISSSRVIYKPKDCTLYNLCDKPNKVKNNTKKTTSRVSPIIKKTDEILDPIMIIKDK